MSELRPTRSVAWHERALAFLAVAMIVSALAAIAVAAREGANDRAIVALGIIGSILGASALLLTLVVARRHARFLDEASWSGFESVMEAAGLGLLQVGADGTVQSVSPEGSKLLGYTAEQLIGQRPERLIVSRPGERGALLAQRERWTGEGEFVCADGTLLPVAIRSAPITELGAPAGVVIVFEDRSEHLRRDQEREELVALASHELRGPLTSVLGFARLLHRSYANSQPLPEEEARDAIEVLAVQAERMRQAVEAFLDITRLEADALPLEIQPVALQTLLRTEAAALRLRYPAAEVREEYSANGREIVLTSDPQFVRQILGNLLDNAAKFADSQHPQVLLALAASDGGGASIAVRDNGPGIAAQDQPHIFERFYRRPSQRTATQGIGLGLYIARRVADQLGASLSFETWPGSGTEFRLELPPSPPRAPAAREMAPSDG